MIRQVSTYLVHVPGRRKSLFVEMQMPTLSYILKIPQILLRRKERRRRREITTVENKANPASTTQRPKYGLKKRAIETQKSIPANTSTVSESARCNEPMTVVAARKRIAARISHLEDDRHLPHRRRPRVHRIPAMKVQRCWRIRVCHRQPQDSQSAVPLHLTMI